MTMARTLALLFVAAVVAAPNVVRAQGDSLAGTFAEGNAAYEAGDYTHAIEDYVRVAEAGAATPDLYYNLGNAHFKAGELGRAILWYERARRLAPRDADLRENLGLTRSLLRDQQLVSTESRWRRTMLAWHRETTTRESALVAVALYVVVCALGILFVFRDTDAVSRGYARVSMVSPGRLLGLDKAQDLGLAIALVLAVGGAFAASTVSKVRAERARSQGVMIAAEASVFSGPSREAPVQFKVHEGTLVSVRDARPGWIRVELPGELSGWVDETSLDRI